MKEPEQTPIDRKEVVAEEPVVTTPADTTKESAHQRQPIGKRGIWISGLIIFLIVVVGLCGVVFAQYLFRDSGTYRGSSSWMHNNDNRKFDRGYGGGHMMNDYYTSTQDGSTIISGVVSAINGDTITVIGNGNSENIKTDSSTTYSTSSKKVSVNDSVIVRGVANGDTFTANSIIIVNR
ncbi:MAG: DUF5666 domain-containing protein [Candidatus Saccharimonadales bacterium]